MKMLLTMAVCLMATLTYGTPTPYEVKQAKALYRAVHPICEACLSKGRMFSRIEVHHVHPVEAFPEEAADPSNLISFCQPCHLKIGHAGNFKLYVANVREILAVRQIRTNKEPAK